MAVKKAMQTDCALLISPNKKIYISFYKHLKII